jgi:hypothetical protein
MAALDLSQCPAVESVPDRRSGAWVFRGTRMPAATVFEKSRIGIEHRRNHRAVRCHSRADSGSNLPPAASTRRRCLSVWPVRLMRVLFDRGVPRALAASITKSRGHRGKRGRWRQDGQGAHGLMADGRFK